jgi:hypothetical protein
MLKIFVNQHILSTKLAGLTLANQCARAEPAALYPVGNHRFDMFDYFSARQSLSHIKMSKFVYCYDRVMSDIFTVFMWL